MNISLVIGLKNNLDYSKHFYKTTRALYPEVEICFSSYNSTDGTHEWLDEIKQADSYVKCWWSDSVGTFSDNFNKAAEIGTKDYVAYLHNDVVLAPGFVENLAKHVAPNHVVSYTTIEPPIFAGHERPGKIIHDLGTDLESFDLPGLYSYVEKKQPEYLDKTEPGITFFMCMPRKALLEIGGMDNLYNPMFCEDDDIINRFKLVGLETFTALDAICYHFVSKTSRFSEEYQNKTQEIEGRSNRNYIRKWGSRGSTKKYDVGYIVSNCGLPLLAILEPWCSTIYFKDDYNLIVPDYLKSEQPNTKFDLRDRIKPYDNEKQNEILVEFDASKLTQESFNILMQLPEIIAESGEIGTFELDIYKITINALNRYEQLLITNSDKWYTDQLI